MANTTDPFAQSVHGTNPQYLIEKITRQKIYNCVYWKEQCFGLTAETILDKAIALKYCGGTYGGNLKPTNFLCLVLKLLQLQPELDIILEFIKNEDFKYLRALGAFYLRLVGKVDIIYQYLEPLLNDYRKLSYRGMSGWQLMHMDEFIDSLLRDELVCDMALPHLVKRMKLEELGTILPRKSALDDEIAMGEGESEDSESEDEDSVQEDTELEPATPAVAVSTSPNEQPVEHNKGDSRSEKDRSAANSRGRSPSPRHRDRSPSPRHRDRSPSPRHRDRSESREHRKDSHGRRDERRREDSRERRRPSSRDDRRRHRDRHSRSRSPLSEDSRDDRRYRRHDHRDSRHRRSRDRRDSRSPDRRHHRSNRRSRSRSRSHSPARRSSTGHGRSDSRDRDSRTKDRRDQDRDRERDREADRKRGYSEEDRRDSKRPRSDRDQEESEVPVVSDTATQKAKSAAVKKFDRMFGGKTKPARTPSGTSAPLTAAGGRGGGKEVVNTKGEKVMITASEGTVEYWNQMREALGLKKLK